MIWKIAKKEFHNNLLTFRFTFGSLILIFLVLAINLGVTNRLGNSVQNPLLNIFTSLDLTLLSNKRRASSME